MSFETWVIIATRAGLAIAAGEIAIRYAAWWWVVWRRRALPAVWPILIGVAICAACTCVYEGSIIYIRSEAPAIFRPEILLGYHVPEVARIFEFVGACFLTYPVSKLQYNHTWERALIEVAVRIFIGGICMLIGWELSSVYHCIVLHSC